ncbi:hypothetical protein C8A05DRAFT_13964 [Staphylotrichum tortipilum]|uniref:Uncharacterized protein n=1 Tax=Staphylotrichum tortipilum TaxID=2831512 RepID=A0AAN6RVC9_9PEZI|nr:hypothetical protein C8A05DRAFT_13964 [Staphylotrichum longicolle]
MQTAQPLAMDALLDPPMASVRHYPQHSHDLALQKYLLLQEQHELLHQHLDELRPLCTPVSHSPPSPPRSPSRRSHSPDESRLQHQRSSFSLPTRKGSCASTTSSSPEVEVAIEEAKLCDVNEGLKRALTELLNCERGRADHAFRTWVQCRLLDTERELRSRRRRRSAPGP